MLYGRFQHNIDAKGRIFVPAKLRKELGDSFIAAAVLDHCVSLYSLEEWDKLQEKLADMPMTKARKLQRYLSANAADVQVDAQGRILLPKNLLAYAGLEKEALVVGTGKLQLATGAHPGAMKDAVCSPGGTTIVGVAALERRGFRGAVIDAIDEIEHK